MDFKKKFTHLKPFNKNDYKPVESIELYNDELKDKEIEKNLKKYEDELRKKYQYFDDIPIISPYRTAQAKEYEYSKSLTIMSLPIIFFCSRSIYFSYYGTVTKNYRIKIFFFTFFGTLAANIIDSLLFYPTSQKIHKDLNRSLYLEERLKHKFHEKFNLYQYNDTFKKEENYPSFFETLKTENEIGKEVKRQIYEFREEFYKKNTQK